MSIRRVLLPVIVVLFVAGGLLVGIALAKNGSQSEALPDAAELAKHAVEIGGEGYSFVAGNAYKRDKKTGAWSLVEHVYDPDFFAKNYVVKDGQVFRRSEDGGKLHAMSKSFKADFEDARDLRELIGEKYKWTSFVLQSPKARDVPDYVRLRAGILAGKADFLDNRLEPSDKRAHAGRQALRAQSAAPAAGMSCSKAHIETEFLHFVKGDDYWFSGWYYVESGLPYTISDIKSGWLLGTPGLRLALDDGEPQFELKWADKPRYKQAAAAPVKFPLHRWTHVKIHLKLSDQNDGLNELWLDGQQIIRANGRNLPLADTVYNHLEVGISAALQDAVLFVDDVEVSDKPL